MSYKEKYNNQKELDKIEVQTQSIERKKLEEQKEKSDLSPVYDLLNQTGIKEILTSFKNEVLGFGKVLVENDYLGPEWWYYAAQDVGGHGIDTRKVKPKTPRTEYIPQQGQDFFSVDQLPTHAVILSIKTRQPFFQKAGSTRDWMDNEYLYPASIKAEGSTDFSLLVQWRGEAGKFVLYFGHESPVRDLNGTNSSSSGPYRYPVEFSKGGGGIMIPEMGEMVDVVEAKLLSFYPEIVEKSNEIKQHTAIIVEKLKTHSELNDSEIRAWIKGFKSGNKDLYFEE